MTLIGRRRRWPAPADKIPVRTEHDARGRAREKTPQHRGNLRGRQKNSSGDVK